MDGKDKGKHAKGARVTLTLHLSHHRLAGLQPVLRGRGTERKREIEIQKGRKGKVKV